MQRAKTPDLGDWKTSDLHEHMHKRLRLGDSNTSSVYYQSWQRIKPMADSSISNSYITHAAFTYAERKTAMNWRFGTLWSNKMAYQQHVKVSPLRRARWG